MNESHEGCATSHIDFDFLSLHFHHKRAHFAWRKAECQGYPHHLIRQIAEHRYQLLDRCLCCDLDVDVSLIFSDTGIRGFFQFHPHIRRVLSHLFLRWIGRRWIGRGRWGRSSSRIHNVRVDVGSFFNICVFMAILYKKKRREPFFIRPF